MPTSSRHYRRNIALTALPALVVATMAALPTTAHAAAGPITLVGDLQSELGCGGDWDTGCAETQLAPDPDGNFSATLTIPAGNWNYKITVGDSFDENYGVGGARDGANIPLAVGGPSLIHFVYSPTTHKVSVAPQLLTGSDDPADATISAAPARQAGTNEQFYFVMTDRFANGDAGNDLGDLPAADSGFDPSNKGFYHGGDLRGLMNQLDYIQGLGTTAIWLTPSFANRAVQGTGADRSAGYHGYWITDFTRIDPHLGTNAEMTELIDAAHARGLKVYFDIITNHTADVISYPEGNDYVSTQDSPYRTASGEAFSLQDVANTPSFPAMNAASFPKTPTLAPGDENAKTPAWLNDVTLYHNRGDSTYTGESTTLGDFSGLDDLMTESPTVVNGFVDIYKSWVDFGIDGFRIDTLKHVNPEFWQQWTPQIMDYAHSQGRNDFFMFGEVYDSNPQILSSYVTSDQVPGVLDFGFQDAAVKFARGDASATLGYLFAADDNYTSATTSAHSEPTFLGNHDMGRIGYFLAGTDNTLKRDELAHSLMYLTRGQPVVYYGDEQGLQGAGGDKDARQDMFATSVDSYAAESNLLGTTGSLDRYDTNSVLYQHIAELSQLRADNPALTTGAQRELLRENTAGVYAFSRIDRDEKVEYVVALNNATSDRTVSLATATNGGTFTAIYGGTGTATSDGAGTLSVTVPALSAVVYRAGTTITAPTEAAPVVFAAPLAGATVEGKAEISVEPATSGYSETSFAYRVLGSDTWVPLGTDDDGRPRVFHDTSALAKGTIVEYRAVTTDSAGHRSAASTYAGVGVDLGAAAPVDTGVLITLPGTHNQAMGCGGNWAPECTDSRLSEVTVDGKRLGVYTATFDVPAGSYDFKVAVGGNWDENYGKNGVRGGDNIHYTWGGGPLTFYYDPVTHIVTNTAMGDVVTLAGTFQQALGCSGNWQNDCLASWLRPTATAGTYTFSTGDIPAGNYEVKVVHNFDWSQSYGQDGSPSGSNIAFTVDAGKQITFTYTVSDHRLQITTSDKPVFGMDQQRAQWVSEKWLALPKGDLPSGVTASTAGFTLSTSHDASTQLVDGALTGAMSYPLTYVAEGLPANLKTKYPALADYVALRLDGVSRDVVEQALTGQLRFSVTDGAGAVRVLTGVQIPGVLDDLCGDAASQRTFGPTWDGATPSLAVWAPTAQSVRALVWPGGDTGAAPVAAAMTRQSDGSWTVTGEASWRDAPYLFEVVVYAPTTDAIETNLVTDPYSVGLTLDSTHSVLVDLNDPAWEPALWSDTAAPVLAKAVDHSIYELHVRDFSAKDASVPVQYQGKYLAFTQEDSDGMKHLRELSDAGLTTVHLLPTFDIASIPEDPATQSTPACDLASYGPSSSEQQACVAAVAATDAFNWGYDPWHYSTPEGSYAVNAYGGNRVSEFRSMVGGLHRANLQVVLDVVFNHTAQSGQGDKSVLDKVVPGYYQRLDASGAVQKSTCCENVATEHEMAQKLMVDSIVTWAKDYHVDGFRFDLMGHHSRENMEAVRAALDELTMAKDGVDGASIYLYGEGWNFGEVENNALFEQATQGQLNGTGIGTFSDRLRDAVHGGSPFTDPRVQGFGTGLLTDPNASGLNGTEAEQRSTLLHDMDLVALGMAGNLADYSFTTTSGDVRTGAQIDYNGAPAGYASSPEEVVNYVDAHDNQTLFDMLTMKLPSGTSMDDRVRMNTLSLATVALGQSPFLWHAGTDMLRSKSLDGNSYDSGDWFNAIDWTGVDNGFGHGLPQATDNSDNWPAMTPLLADASLKPSAGDVASATAAAEDLLKLRFSSDLFRLGDASLIQQKVSFPVSGADVDPGVLVMRVDDTVGVDVDSSLDGLLVVVNATPHASSQTVAGLAGTEMELSSVQQQGSDAVVKGTAWDSASGTVTVPARTVAVLVAPQDVEPTPEPTDGPTETVDPTEGPTGSPTAQPTDPTAGPTGEPTGPVTGGPTSTEPSTSALPQVSLSSATVAQGSRLTVTVANLAPGERTSIWLHSNPVLLVTGFADANGVYAPTVTIPADTVVGAHEIGAVGERTGVEVMVPLAVVAADGIASTGSDVSPALLLSLMAFVAGLTLVVVRRRKVVASPVE